MLNCRKLPYKPSLGNAITMGKLHCLQIRLYIDVIITNDSNAWNS